MGGHPVERSISQEEKNALNLLDLVALFSQIDIRDALDAVGSFG